MTDQPVDLNAARANMHAQAVTTAMQILGGNRSSDAKAIADLIVARWEQVSDAAAELIFLDLDRLSPDEIAAAIQERTKRLVEVATVNVSLVALEALDVAVRGRSATRQA